MIECWIYEEVQQNTTLLFEGSYEVDTFAEACELALIENGYDLELFNPDNCTYPGLILYDNENSNG